MSIDLRLNSRYLTKRLKILIFVKKLRVHCNLYVINDPPCNSVYAAKRLNKRLLLQWSCYSLTKIFETSLKLTCDQVLVFLFWTVRGVLIQPWSKLLGHQRNSWSTWGIFLPPPLPPEQCWYYAFKSQHCCGEAGTAEIGSYNNISKHL